MSYIMCIELSSNIKIGFINSKKENKEEGGNQNMYIRKKEKNMRV